MSASQSSAEDPPSHLKAAPRPGRQGAFIGAVTTALVCAAILIANFQKGFQGVIQGWGLPYWWLDYRHGLVRRGLVGQLFQALVGRLDEAHLVAPVTIAHLGCCAVLAAATLWLVIEALRTPMTRARWALAAAVAIWIAAAEFWPTIAYTEGYMDAVVLAVAVVAALLVRARIYIAAGVLLFLGPFIHEYFVFLVPFILASERLPPAEAEAPAGTAEVMSLHDAPEPPGLPRHLFVLGAVAVVAAVIVTFGVGAQATRLEIAAMPMTAAFKSMLASTTLTQTVGQSFSASASQMFEHPGFTAKTYAFFLLPGLIAGVALLFWRGRTPSISLLARAAAGLFPVAALLIAWDVSRLLVMSNLTVGLLFLMVVRDSSQAEPPSDVGPSPTPWAVVALAGFLALGGLGYALMPMAYAYYWPGPVTFFPLKVWPGDGRNNFGLKRLWPYAATVESHAAPFALLLAPSATGIAGPQAPGLLHQLRSNLVGAREEADGWRIPAHPGGDLLVFGPYLPLPAGERRVTVHVTLEGSPERCRDATKAFRPSISVTKDGGTSVLRPRAPATVAIAADNPCSLTLRSGFVIPAGGSAQVETPLYGPAPLPMRVDGYGLEAAAAAQSR